MGRGLPERIVAEGVMRLQTNRRDDHHKYRNHRMRPDVPGVLNFDQSLVVTTLPKCPYMIGQVQRSVNAALSLLGC